MRLVTFNALHGANVEDGLVDLDRFAAAVVALDPDVLALQEVDRGQPRSHGADLADVAAQAMGAADTRFVAAMAGDPWRPAPRSVAPEVAAYGVALLSRHPISDWRELRLPRIPVAFPFPRRDPRRLVWMHEERRTAVLARLETPEGDLLVGSTHLSFVPGWGQLQLRSIRRALPRAAGPAVLMGDLNMTPALARRITGLRPLVTAWTFPADHPRLQIDHVLARGDVGEVVDARAVRLPVSDHRALVVELDRSRLG